MLKHRGARVIIKHWQRDGSRSGPTDHRIERARVACGPVCVRGLDRQGRETGPCRGRLWVGALHTCMSSDPMHDRHRPGTAAARWGGGAANSPAPAPPAAASPWGSRGQGMKESSPNTTRAREAAGEEP